MRSVFKIRARALFAKLKFMTSGHISSTEMVILLWLGGLPFDEDIGYCKNKLTFYAHVGIIELKTGLDKIIWVFYVKKTKRFVNLYSFFKKRKKIKKAILCNFSMRLLKCFEKTTLKSCSE